MRYLVLSDIHSNIEALEACVGRAKQAGYDAALCCGDIVGYGPNPKEAIDVIRGLDALTIRGNHDRVASGLDEPTHFNVNARQAVFWTRAALPDSYREYLAGLPLGPVNVGNEAQLVHGAVTHEDNYIFTQADADENVKIAQRRITFFGHSHIPVAFTLNDAGRSVHAMAYELDEYTAVQCDGSEKFFFNPGSIGQPRDGDPRASFAIWDEDHGRMEFYRVEYAFRETQAKMRAAELPPYLIDRLSHGR